jgi:hypothetical protein
MLEANAYVDAEYILRSEGNISDWLREQHVPVASLFGSADAQLLLKMTT